MENKLKYVERFKALHKCDTGKEISDLEALERFEKLITLVRAVYRPLPKINANKNN